MEDPPGQESGRVAFVCAMPMELAPLRRKLSLRAATLGSLEGFTGSLGGRPVVAVVTGMGTALAADHVERLLSAVDIDWLVVVGITGAVEPDMPIGTLVLPALVVDGASGAEYRPHPMGPGSPRGMLWTSDDLITDQGVIAELRDRGVVSLDMETAAIAAVCQERGIAWSVFRCISDRATDGSVDEELFRLSRQDGTPDTKAVIAHVAKHPGRVPGLVRMAREAKLATELAADAAVAAVGTGAGER